MTQRQNIVNRIAMVIRYLSIPPVMVTLLILVLNRQDPGVFRSAADLWVTLIGLAIFPVLAYPLTLHIPCLRRRGREYQRDMAFVFSVLGYVGAWLCGLFFLHNRTLTLIFSIYLLSVLFLLLANKVFHWKASGHICSITGPLLLCCWFLGPIWLLPGLILYALIFWASLITKRHSVSDLLLGSLLCLLAAFMIWLGFVA